MLYLRAALQEPLYFLSTIHNQETKQPVSKSHSERRHVSPGTETHFTQNHSPITVQGGNEPWESQNAIKRQPQDTGSNWVPWKNPNKILELWSDSPRYLKCLERKGLRNPLYPSNHESKAVISEKSLLIACQGLVPHRRCQYTVFLSFLGFLNDFHLSNCLLYYLKNIQPYSPT